ncbi:unnamed protein product [Cercopithifilaria johnstoni]|uniref:Uncharacterized protein n=1 Tax=Cercopithifilaria johnstoni TaxID=2874296 RepID=A0A8J2M0H6_9BILA|nr:unnamed protein product [Cercopithifilaria johnstoni]
MNSQQKGKLMRNDLLWIANGNSMLRASLILLTVVMIFFTVMKICKLFYQIRNHQREQQTSESDNETPQVLVKSERSSSGNKKRYKEKQKLERTSHT